MHALHMPMDPCGWPPDVVAAAPSRVMWVGRMQVLVMGWKPTLTTAARKTADGTRHETVAFVTSVLRVYGFFPAVFRAMQRQTALCDLHLPAAMLLSECCVYCAYTMGRLSSCTVLGRGSGWLRVYLR